MPLSQKRQASQGLVRKRGGQPGNSNRLSHGGYTRAEAVRRAALKRLLHETDMMLIWAANITRAREALRRKRARALTSPEVGRSFARRTGGGGARRARPQTTPVCTTGPHPTCCARRPPHEGEVKMLRERAPPRIDSTRAPPHFNFSTAELG